MNDNRRRESDCCGHVFQTIAQRIAHERKVERDERVTCPCGHVCNEGPNPAEEHVDAF